MFAGHMRPEGRVFETADLDHFSNVKKWSIFYLNGLAVNHIISDIVLVITGLTHTLVDSFALLGSLSL
jgi:hypothetical protein